MLTDVDQLRVRREKVATKKKRIHEESIFPSDQHIGHQKRAVVKTEIVDSSVPGPSGYIGNIKKELSEEIHENTSEIGIQGIHVKTPEIGIPDVKDAAVRRCLTAKEWQIIAELERSYSSLFVARKGKLTLVPEPKEKTVDFVNTSKDATEKIVKYFKSVTDFNNLDKDAQLIILKARMLQSLILRSTYDYRKDLHAWDLPNVEKPVNFDSLVKSLGPDNEEAMNEVFQLSLDLQENVGQDAYLYAILHLIIIFSPITPGLSQRQTISDLHIKYIILMKHYLEYKFSYQMCKTYLPHLLANLNVIDRLGESFTKALTQMPLMNVDPLMSEVLNL